MSEIDRFAAGKEFHLKEYESLKKEIFDLVEHSRKLEIYVVGAMAAFYAWFIKEQPVTSALCIPIVLALLGGFRAFSTLIRINEIAGYLRAMEGFFALNNVGVQGWESYRQAYKKQSGPGHNKFAAPFFTSAAVFWTLLALVSSFLWLFSVLRIKWH